MPGNGEPQAGALPRQGQILVAVLLEHGGQLPLPERGAAVGTDKQGAVPQPAQLEYDAAARGGPDRVGNQL